MLGWSGWPTHRTCARRLSQALVRHLHAFIWEIEPTEWEIRREMDGDWFSLEREFRLARLA
jgi:hypothetical protein